MRQLFRIKRGDKVLIHSGTAGMAAGGNRHRPRRGAESFDTVRENIENFCTTTALTASTTLRSLEFSPNNTPA
jgi:hypothetical protein